MLRRNLIPALGVALALVGCDVDQSPTPPVAPDVGAVDPVLDADAFALSIVEASNWADDVLESAPASESRGLPRGWIAFQGREIVGDVAHYEWRVRIGAGPYDVIGLHRVVAERRPWRPIRTADNVFMLHGDLKDFEGCFLPGLVSGATPDEFGAAVHLARANVDVWGLDHATTLVPASETDLTFMSEWGLEKHARDATIGLSIARAVRALTGSSFRKMHLLGYSGGSSQGFALLNAESQRPTFLRNVAGFIPIDTGMLNDDPDYTDSNCGTVAYYDDLLAAGEYGEYSVFLLFGEPARDDPDGPSELWPGLTNLEAAIAVGALPFDPAFPIHFWAGEFDAEGVPLGLQYTDVDLLIDFMTNAPAYLPTRYSREIYLAHCTGGEPWTENLGDMENPILWVSAQGGFGPWETHTLDVLGSTDIEPLNVQLHPDEEQDLDFGHVDLFTAGNAPELVWQPILEWILAHRVE